MPLTIEEKKQRAKFSRIFKTYGITKEQYEELDHGLCPVCLKSWSSTIVPCVDHDHVSGKIRGLLCRYCNRYRVGHFRDVDLVGRILKYLQDAGTLPDWIVPKKKKRKRKNKKIVKKDINSSRRSLKSSVPQPKV